MTEAKAWASAFAIAAAVELACIFGWLWFPVVLVTIALAVTVSISLTLFGRVMVWLARGIRSDFRQTQGPIKGPLWWKVMVAWMVVVITTLAPLSTDHYAAVWVNVTGQPYQRELIHAQQTRRLGARHSFVAYRIRDEDGLRLRCSRGGRQSETESVGYFEGSMLVIVDVHDCRIVRLSLHVWP